jgi:hypothetical protein
LKQRVSKKGEIFAKHFLLISPEKEQKETKFPGLLLLPRALLVQISEN